MSNDPFSILYAHLWDVFNTSPYLQNVVRTKNRVRFDENDRDPYPQQIQDGDLPEVILDVTGCAVNLQQSSCTTSVDKRLAFLVCTGDQRINSRLFPIQWQMLCMFTKLQRTSQDIQWNGKSFVLAFEITDMTEGLSNPQNRGIKGWSSVLNFVAKLSFQTRDMIEFSNT